ncbi:MAG TPA: glycosyltransferase [Chloroflexi bacterium]|nr:glycosyltransferase [Chloroflexota bacterium]
MRASFLTSRRKHALMITNHGVHQWQVTPGLPDTGGQNVFVNRFTGELARLSFRVTVVNRGGYLHPVTGRPQRGVCYGDEQRRILYLEDGGDEFVRKEEMAAHIPALAAALTRFLEAENTPVDLIFSHYWDGARIGQLYRQTLPAPVPHIWTPHSLGAIKKRNVSPGQWAELRIEERITLERDLLTGGELDGVAATSSALRQALRDDYGYAGPIYFLPPCVDPDRFHPRQVTDTDPIWEFLSQRSGLTPAEVRRSRIVTEISRTDTTKRKKVLIEAFALLQQRIPDSFLIVSIDQSQAGLARDLVGLIRTLGVGDRVAALGSVWDLLPTIYAVTDVYCTPSVMEGFGMSAQEAAATGVPVVSSPLVPFVTEYLMGKDVKAQGDLSVRVGQGAIVVPVDDVMGFSRALELLLTDDPLRERMGAYAYHITLPYFTWQSRVADFLTQAGLGDAGVGVGV